MLRRHCNISAPFSVHKLVNRSTFTTSRLPVAPPSPSVHLLRNEYFSYQRFASPFPSCRKFPLTFLPHQRRFFSQTRIWRSGEDPKDSKAKVSSALAHGTWLGKHGRGKKDGEGEEEEEEGRWGPGPGYLPFPPPFHTINIMSLLLLGNVFLYLFVNYIADDEQKDFIIEHFTLSHENAWRGYTLLSHAFYQEHFLQLAIDSWLLWTFGNTMIGFLGGKRLAFFWALATLGGAALHLGRQQVEMYYGLDPLEVRGRCYGPNPFILGLVAVEGLIFRHLNFIAQPPVPFLVLTAFVMVIDVWRIFTTKPAEHGASTGGALMAYAFWLLPTRYMGMDKLTAAM